ncbi:MAG: CRISPR repeat RNA endoribonuclease Cas6 [uncultured Sulfurovum sp.]|uniref:CRISPR repeat RNA endoribonuclease Cas6 n=1 Tax=uncultured Sulfurovum sp. TaxID=269237 RepID=A0A6S6U4R1_9BACT|nr:MAG: CRISPR repeat RNA endoribonuclease Cas6 [uncultured Sulfurovum sp.]
MNHHHVSVTINSSKKPSYFTGSMLRGAMGYALKKVTCINPSYECKGCFAQSSCLYYNFYEQQNNFHNYRFEIELGSEKFNFALYLFNEACESLAYILSALEMTLTQIGLGREKQTFHDFNIKLNGQKIYDGKEFCRFDFIEQNILKIDSFCPNLKIKLRTPLRIKKNNKFLRDDVDIEDILRSIYQKEQEFNTGKKAFKLVYEPSYTTAVKALRYQSLVRKSNRQKQKLNMDGIVGEIVVMGLDEESHRLLKVGEVIGVGKQTVMGLGRIEVIDL